VNAAEAADRVAARFPLLARSEFRGEISISIDRSHLREVCAFLKNELGFSYLVDLSSVDHFESEPRFELVYELYQFEHGTHLRLKTPVPESEPEADSVADLWETANWHEREVYDMMGLRFKGHPDLRRILMWEGYPYHPLRKDFPLAGKPSDLPDVAFSQPAPLAGGPFVTAPTTASTVQREPRSREG
jgi:NADH-quinone oxidoreductase subunit C